MAGAEVESEQASPKPALGRCDYRDSGLGRIAPPSPEHRRLGWKQRVQALSLQEGLPVEEKLMQ